MINIEDYVGYKIILYPTEELRFKFEEYFAASINVYNLGIQLEEMQKYSQKEKKFLKFYDLNNKVNYLKNNDINFQWLTRYDSTTIKLVLQDVIYAYEMFFQGRCNYPRYKDMYSRKQFPIRSDRMAIAHNGIKVPSIGFINYYNSYGNQIIGNGDKLNKNSRYLKYIDPRISFDGLNYYLSFSLPKDEEHNINSYRYYAGNPEWQLQETGEAIGIDVGIKREKWMKDSTGRTVERPDNDAIHKKIAKLQRKYNRQYRTNKEKGRINENYPQTKNMIKTQEKIDKCYKKITNRRRNAVYKYSKDLLEQKPKAVVIENLSSSNMIVKDDKKECNFQKNKINAQIYDAALYESMNIIKRKMEANGIPVIQADPQYPSSQICSRCGYRQNIGQKKIYKCPNCGLEIDRDLNASINLANLIKE